MKYLLSITAFILLTVNTFAQFGAPADLLQLELFQSFDKVHAGSEFKIAARVQIGETWHINSDKPYDEFLIPSAVSIEENENFVIQKTKYPPAHDIKLAFSEDQLSVWEGEIWVGALIKSTDNLQPGKYNLIVNFDYQACNDNTCLAPSSVQDTLIIEIIDKKGVANEINQNIFKNIDLSYSLPSDSGDEDGGDPITNALESSGILVALLIVFAGGLALNLTPCVYPLIPITIGYFGGQSEGSTRKLFMMGLLFVLGMAITYSVIGVITALSGAVFGALLQNPIVIVFIALIFVALSLSMFGVYEFKLPDSLVAKAGGAKSGMFGAFFMGLTMGIVAAPCIGPFVLGLVTYVAAKGEVFEGFLMFFVLAIGLGLPYLLLAIFSGKIKKLPRAGEWMEAVKHIFGFILIGMALYFILPLLPKEISGYVLPLFMLIAALYLIFVDKLANRIKGFRIFKTAFSLLLIAIAVYSLIPSSENSINWSPYTDTTFSNVSDEKKAVIIDFYADWCIPCKELDKFTFTDEKVIKESERFTTLKADMTKSLQPEVEALKEKYDIVGVPTVLILDSNGNEVERITGFVGPDEFYNIIKNVQ